MKIFKTVLLFTLAVALGLAVGFAFRGSTDTRVHEHTADGGASLLPSNSAVAATADTQQFSRLGKSEDSPLATQLASDLSMSHGVTRWLHWLEAVEKAQLSDFPRLALVADGNSIAIDLVAARWIELNPRHLFDTIAAQQSDSGVWASLGNTLFKEWPKRDMNGVIDALSSTNFVGNGGRMKNWRWQVAGKLIETDPEVGVKLFHEWNIENYGPRMTGIARWAAENPRHAAEVALAHPAGHASELIMQEIGKQWGQVNPAEALEFTATRRDQYNSVLAASALKAWAERDLPKAAEWLVSTDPSTRNRLSPPFVEAWGKKDAEAALDWSENNLSGTTLAQAVGSLIKGAAENDVRAAAELVNSLKPSSARAEGAAAVAQKWMPEYSSRNAVSPELKAWLAQLDPQSLRHALENQVQWRWTENDPKDFANFLAQLRPEQVPDRSYAQVARTFARSNPEQALEWASQLPERAALNAGQEAFATWFESQSELATRWLESLPPKDPRIDRYFETAVRNLAFNNASERLAALPEHRREAARQIIEKLPLGTEHRKKVLAAFSSTKQ
ncbi:MAG TPA: hypothetical protein VF773_11330 [Verrucomicrobiae bacterium]